MATTTERLGQPYEVLVTRDGDRLVELIIRAVGDGATLDHDTISAALRTLQQRLYADSATRGRHTATDDQSGTLHALRAASDQAGSEITPRYLAALSVAYEEVSSRPGHGSITAELANVIGRPAQTVKGHFVRARKEGYLSPIGQRQTGGCATEKARTTLA